jgi:general secretion pathway protein D
MKHSVPARSFASLLVVLCLLAAPVAVLAKKGEKNFKRGVEHEKAQQWERAAQEFALAVAANPSEMEFQLHYRRALFNASQKFMEQGRTLAEQGDYRGAYNAYRQAYGYDPVNELALAEMERVLRLQREREGANGGGNGNGGQARPGAGTVPTSYDGAAAGAPVAARPAQQQPAQPPPATRDEVQRVINYSGDLEGFIRQTAEKLEMNVIFDRDFPRRTVTINLRNVTAARALDHVFVAHGLFFQRLDRRTILVADQTKRGQYQQLVLRTFYLQNIDPNDARTLINASLPPNAGRQPVVTPNKATNSITVRDTAENIRLIEDLLASIDKDRAEVVMDVSIYEVSRTDLLQLGNQIGDASTLGNLGGLNPLQILVGGPNGRGGVVTNPGTGDGKGGGTTKALADVVTTAAGAVALPTAIGGAFVLPATRLSLFQSRENTRLLAHTQVHAFDGEQSSTRIGQKVPIQTAQVTPFGGFGAGATQPQQGATTGLFGGSGFPVIQYQDTGLILKFTPQVFPNQDVQVKMEIESNDVIGGANALTPTFSQRSVSGMARIPNNRTMMIASVAQDKESRGRQGLPLLGLIPVLGRLFSLPTRNDVNNDIVITVTPRVLRAPVVTPEDIEIRPSGTLQSPVGSTLEAMVHEAEREEQLAAARQLPTDVSVELPPAPSPAAEAASAHHAQAPAAQTARAARPADAEQPAFVPAPKILAGAPAGAPAGGGLTAVNAFAPSAAAVVPAVHTEDPLPPSVKAAENKPAAPSAATAPDAPSSAAANIVAAAPQAELYVVAGQAEMRVGGRQRLMVFIKTPTPLALAAATLKFDPKVIAVRSVEKGSLFAEGAAQPSVTQSVDQSGSVLALVAPAAGAPITGMGVLLFVEIEALRAGETVVGFEQTGVHLMSADGRSLPAHGSQIRLAVKQ